MPSIMSSFRPACVLLLAGTALFGVAYPLAVTGISSAAFPHASHGSLVMHEGKAIGSELLGQPFTSPRYFWGRPSATTPPYNAAGSGASNLGPSNPELRKAVDARVQALHKADPENKKLIPADLVEASASGLDPDISPQAAEYQVPRVARARGLEEKTVRSLVRSHIEKRQFGLLGQPRVNVLQLNLALDEKSGRRSAAGD